MVKILRFFEKNLDLGELEKPLGDGKRGDILVRKLRDPESEFSFVPKKGSPPFKSRIINSDEIIDRITKNGNFDSNLSTDFFKPKTLYKPVLKSEDGRMFHLNDLEKTKEFGSSRGSSLGTVDSKIIETIQCMFFALQSLDSENKMNYDFRDPRTIRVEYFLEPNSDEIRKDILNRVKSSVKITSDILSSYRGESDKPSSWWNSFCYSVDRFYNFTCYFESPVVKYKEITILPLYWDEVFHHVDYNGVDSVPKTLKRKFSELNPKKNVKFEKWNPSDVYAVSSYNEFLIIEQIEDCKSLAELNQLLLKLFDERKMRGISLKKTGREIFPDLVINNQTIAPDYKLKSFKDSPNPLDTISFSLICDVVGFPDFKNKLVLRSFGGENIQDIQGEGEQYPQAESKQGKISLKAINDILEKYLKRYDFEIDKVPDVSQLKKLSDDQLIMDIQKAHQEIFGKTDLKVPGNVSRARLISKYQAIYFGLIIHRVKQENLYWEFLSKETIFLEEIILRDILHYAMSIKNIHFDSSVYVRFL